MSHYLYFVKVKKGNAETSEEAQQIAYSELESNGFNDESTFYGGGKCDWFVVGGRWSGLFTDRKEVHEEVKKILPADLIHTLDYLYINKHLVKDVDLVKRIDDIAIEKTGVPFFRNGEQCKDDAVIITKEILQTLKDKYNDVEIAILNEDDEVVDECIPESLTDDDLGDWLVIIDYHN